MRRIKTSSECRYTFGILSETGQGIGGVVHTHSTWAAGFAQAGKILCVRDDAGRLFLMGNSMCRFMTDEEIKGSYELETGKVIVEEFQKREIDPERVPGL